MLCLRQRHATSNRRRTNGMVPPGVNKYPSRRPGEASQVSAGAAPLEPVRTPDGHCHGERKRSNLLARRSSASATLRSLHAVAGAPRTDRRPMGFRIGTQCLSEERIGCHCTRSDAIERRERRWLPATESAPTAYPVGQILRLEILRQRGTPDAPFLLPASPHWEEEPDSPPSGGGPGGATDLFDRHWH